MEGTVEYLERASISAERISLHLYNPKILFILRDPIDRLSSYYNFYISSQLEIPENISFQKYIEYCKEALEGTKKIKDFPIKKKQLRALPAGQYNVYIREFLKYFKRDQILILFYEDLKEDVHGFMKNICDFLDIETSYYSNYNFRKKNVTYSARNQTIHQIAWFIWKKTFRKILNHRPNIKEPLLTLYKKINSQNIHTNQKDHQIQKYLKEFYIPSKDDLQEIVGKSTKIPWCW